MAARDGLGLILTSHVHYHIPRGCLDEKYLSLRLGRVAEHVLFRLVGPERGQWPRLGQRGRGGWVATPRVTELKYC